MKEVWSKEPPTAEGRFWFRGERRFHPLSGEPPRPIPQTVLQVVRGAYGLVVEDSGAGVDLYVGEWMPIPNPDEQAALADRVENDRFLFQRFDAGLKRYGVTAGDDPAEMVEQAVKNATVGRDAEIATLRGCVEAMGAAIDAVRRAVIACAYCNGVGELLCLPGDVTEPCPACGGLRAALRACQPHSIEAVVQAITDRQFTQREACARAYLASILPAECVEQEMQRVRDRVPGHSATAAAILDARAP